MLHQCNILRPTVIGGERSGRKGLWAIVSCFSGREKNIILVKTVTFLRLRELSGILPYFQYSIIISHFRAGVNFFSNGGWVSQGSCGYRCVIVYEVFGN